MLDEGPAGFRAGRSDVMGREKRCCESLNERNARLVVEYTSPEGEGVSY